MATKIEDITAWVEEVKALKAVRLELHSKLDAQLIRLWRLADNDGKAAVTIGGDSLKRAEREGLAVPVVRATFVLYAYDNEGTTYLDRMMLVVDGANAKGRQGETEEYEASSVGLMTQLMRTNLDQTRLILSSQESRHMHAEGMIDRLSKDNERLQ